MQRKGGVKRYKSETDPNVKDRLMLNILIKFDECSTSAAARFLGRSPSCGGKWYHRYVKNGIPGLKNRPRFGRLALVSKGRMMWIRKETKTTGWLTEGVRGFMQERTGSCTVSQTCAK